jgi:hypothetical protein
LFWASVWEELCGGEEESLLTDALHERHTDGFLESDDDHIRLVSIERAMFSWNSTGFQGREKEGAEFEDLNDSRISV